MFINESMINASFLKENYHKTKNMTDRNVKKRKYDKLMDLTSSEVYGYNDNVFRLNEHHIKKRNIS